MQQSSRDESAQQRRRIEEASGQGEMATTTDDGGFTSTSSSALQGPVSRDLMLALLYELLLVEDPQARRLAGRFAVDRLAHCDAEPPSEASTVQPSVSLSSLLLQCVENDVAAVRTLGRNMYEQSASIELSTSQHDRETVVDLLFECLVVQDASARQQVARFASKRLDASPPASSTSDKSTSGLASIAIEDLLLQCIQNDVAEVRELGRFMYKHRSVLCSKLTLIAHNL